MIERQIDPNGYEADVTWCRGQPRVAYVTRPSGALVVDGQVRVSTESVFPVVSQDWAAWKAGPDWEITLQKDGDSAFYGPFPAQGWAAGNHPAELNDDATLFAYQDATQVIRVLEWPSGTERLAIQGTSEGIQQITPHGIPLRYSDHHADQPGMALWQSVTGPDGSEWIAGENTDDALGPLGCVVRRGSKQRLLFAGHASQMPRCALSPDGQTLAVVAGISEGVWFATLTAADLTQDVPKPPEPPTPVYATGFRGIVAWGGQESEATYDQLFEKGWPLTRLVTFHLGEFQLAPAIKTVQQAGGRVLAVMYPEAITHGCPRNIDVNLFNEPDIGTDGRFSVQEVVERILAVYDAARAKGLRLWVPSVSSTDPAALDYLRRVLAQLPHEGIGASFNRYPQDRDTPPTRGRAAYGYDRIKERQAIQAACGDRPYIVTECGYTVGADHHGWWIFGHWHRMDEGTLAKYTKEELTYWSIQPGCDGACVYQLNGPSGIRRPDGSWKPVADIWRT